MRKSPLRRRTELKLKAVWRPEGVVIQRRATLKARGKNYRPIPPAVREEVAARSGGLCEAMTGGQGCGGPCGDHAWRCGGEGRHPANHLHHKLPRSHGGKHVAENLLHVCDGCHREIHAHPERSFRMGWLIRGNRTGEPS